MRRLTIVLMLVGCGFVSDALWIKAKAVLAQYLIAWAWAETVAGQGAPVKPWRWADTWPVARLRMPEPGIELYVLRGADGGSLAFGPGLIDGTAMPGTRGTSVIAGHRDTHFAMLEQLNRGQEIDVQNPAGGWVRYEVDRSQVVDVRSAPGWQIDPAVNELHLVTCYPFDAINPGGPLRYVVVAQRSGPPHLGHPRGQIPGSADPGVRAGGQSPASQSPGSEPRVRSCCDQSVRDSLPDDHCADGVQECLMGMIRGCLLPCTRRAPSEGSNLIRCPMRYCSRSWMRRFVHPPARTRRTGALL